MPNWCEIDFTAKGPKDAIARLIKEVFVVDGDQDNKNPRLDFGKVIPYPKKYLDMDAAVANMSWEERSKKGLKDGFNSGGYEWCCDNWGTKWGSCNPTQLKVTTTGIKQTFSTAWAPPVPVIKKLATMFPSVTFTIKFFERGAAYKGILEVKGSKVLQEEDGEYHGKRGG